MDFTYCYNCCKVGQAAAAKIIADSDINFIYDMIMKE